MAIWNLGSINVDQVYSVPHLPRPGETLSCTARAVFLGGKGANMSVAAARAGAHVLHIGAVGPDGGPAVEQMMEWGVDTRHIAEVDDETAQAIIYVDDAGENTIVLYPGANHQIPADTLDKAISGAETGDWFVCQNETGLQAEGVALARDLGLKVAYAAAPFEASAVTQVLSDLDFLILNEVESHQLAEATKLSAADLPVGDVIVTLGARGARWHDNRAQEVHEIPPVPVTPVDTTGAGDTFTGYTLAALDRGFDMAQALALASYAAALMVTRKGTADVIPDLAEVLAFRAKAEG